LAASAIVSSVVIASLTLILVVLALLVAWVAMRQADEASLQKRADDANLVRVWANHGWTVLNGVRTLDGLSAMENNSPVAVAAYFRIVDKSSGTELFACDWRAGPSERSGSAFQHAWDWDEPPTLFVTAEFTDPVTGHRWRKQSNDELWLLAQPDRRFALFWHRDLTAPRRLR
jgi:hypothetical protein